MSTVRWMALGALAGCGHAAAAPQIQNRAPDEIAQGPLAPGVYACAISEGGYDYPAFRCEVRDQDAHRFLAKVEGSVRLGGEITAVGGGGFRFVGRRFCPWGDCTEHVESVFAPIAGGFRGEVVSALSGPSTVTVTFVRAFTAPERTPDHAGGFGTGPAGFGGGGYGGDPYGGWGYGGYGGWGYGGELDLPDDP